MLLQNSILNAAMSFCARPAAQMKNSLRKCRRFLQRMPACLNGRFWKLQQSKSPPVWLLNTLRQSL
jgi:hypothetical protein